MRLFRSFILAVLLSGLAGVPADAQNTSGYKVSRRITLGGEGGWDFLTVDSEAHRLYITRATRVMVVDVEGGKLVGEIPDTLGVHGVALANKLGRGVTSNGKADSATVFDLRTLAPIATVKTGGKPDAILVDTFSGLVMTFNVKSNDVTLIDPGKTAAVGTVALPGRPESAVSDGKGKVFVNLEDKNMIAVIDVAARNVTASWPLTGCEEPRYHQRLVVAAGEQAAAGDVHCEPRRAQAADWRHDVLLVMLRARGSGMAEPPVTEVITPAHCTRDNRSSSEVQSLHQAAWAELAVMGVGALEQQRRIWIRLRKSGSLALLRLYFCV